MLTVKNTNNGESDSHAQTLLTPQAEKTVQNFINVYNTRSTFFEDSFTKKVKEGNRKAIAELRRFPVPPTQMDLRKDFAECIKANVPDDYSFILKDGKIYKMEELKQLVPSWASIAEKALIESDPVMADKLMSPVQWNAKSAFEVTYTGALNELKNLKRTNNVATAEHYIKWVLTPLKRSIDEVKLVGPPGNALIGYGERIPLKDAVIIAESLEKEFHKVFKQKGIS
jgi:hypothetical protein